MSGAELEWADGRSRLRMQRTFAHPRQQVWVAITEPDQLIKWFPAAVELLPERGSKISFDLGQGPQTHGVVQEVDAPHSIAYSWGDDLLRWELADQGEVTVLRFTHTFADRPGAASLASGWDVCLDALDNVLAGEPVAPRQDTTAEHEAYIKAFGLDEGTSEHTPRGWTVRFERQLTRPIATVWRELTASTTLIPGAPAPHDCTTGEFPPGMTTTVHSPDLIEYQWLDMDGPEGQVRWELTEGTGHGARLILTQTGTPATEHLMASALDAWKKRLNDLAKELSEQPSRGQTPQTEIREADFATEHNDLTVGDLTRGGPEGLVEPESPRGYGGADL